MAEFWSEVLRGEDREIFAAKANRPPLGLGKHPALLVVDAQVGFVGLQRPTVESMAAYPASIGERSYPAVAVLSRLLAAARAGAVPVFFSQSGMRPGEERFSSFKRQRMPGVSISPDKGYDIVPELAPQPGEVVIQKRFPSAFFGTPLMTFLHALGIDTLVIGGFSTGGCVRSTVVDAASYNFRIGVVAEATGDTLDLAHRIHLLEMDMKYADVISAADALSYLASCATTAER